MAELIGKPEQISEDHFLLEINIGTSKSCPGQFANIKIGQGTDPLIRRPFSIFDHKDNIIELVIKVIGKGTRYIRDQFIPGSIDILAPLGKGFSIIENKNVLLVGGGVGNAPLYYLSRILKGKKNIINYIYATQSKKYIYKKAEYESVSDNFYITTDDGSEGNKGFASDTAGELLRKNKYDYIFTCGPEAMMKSIVDLAVKADTPIEVSLEKYFGCGIGLCSGCTIYTKQGQKRACVDGPVFNGRTIKWD